MALFIVLETQDFITKRKGVSMYTIVSFDFHGDNVTVLEMTESGWDGFIKSSNLKYAGNDIYFANHAVFYYLIRQNRSVSKDHKQYSYICGLPVYYCKTNPKYINEYIKQIGNCVIEYNKSGWISKINGLNVTYYSSSNLEKVGNVRSSNTW